MKDLEQIQKDIDELSENPVSLYGEEIGIAKLVRDGMKFRIFSKKVSSGQKADIVDLNIIVEDEQIEGYRYLKGRTYIPHFALKDVYWIMEKKIWNKHHGSQMHIDQSYIKVGKHINGAGARIDKQSPEEHGLELVKFMRHFSASQYPLVLA